MFTVVIAEKEHLESIREYQAFLAPFLEGSDIAFCEWRPEETQFRLAVPRLEETVARRNEWRAVVVCTEAGLHQKNPFDLTRYDAPAPLQDAAQEDETIEEAEARLQRYLTQVRAAKFAAFEQAAAQPLTRLMTHLCQDPTVTRGRNRIAENEAYPVELRGEFGEYQAEQARKQELRAQIRGDERISIALPAEIYCVARRTYTAQDYDLHALWQPRVDQDYSRFYDWNLYYDKMRYLVVDILPKDHNNYEFDYIRFLYAVLLLASHDVPTGSLQPQRVYSLLCENDELALDALLTGYDMKLSITQELLQGKLRDLTTKKRPRLTDQEASSIFCANVTIPVTMSKDTDREGLYSDPQAVGLSGDCPEDETNRWEATYQQSRRTLHKILKQPRRALRRATSDLRGMHTADLDQARSLNDFQVEDVAEHIDEEELAMVAGLPRALEDTSAFDKQMQEQDKILHTKMGKRMTRSGTIAVGATALAVYLAGFLPLLFGSRGSGKRFLWSAVITVLCVGLLALAGWLCLLGLRRIIRRALQDFNGVMHDIENQIEDSMLRFSKYLSHACNVMRGFSVLNFRAENEDPDSMQMRVLKKHIADVQATREELHEIFGQFMQGRVPVDPNRIEPFAYDFARAVDFAYPIQYRDGQRATIEFLQPGSHITLSVNFVRRVALRREELYD